MKLKLYCCILLSAVTCVSAAAATEHSSTPPQQISNLAAVKQSACWAAYRACTKGCLQNGTCIRRCTVHHKMCTDKLYK